MSTNCVSRLVRHQISALSNITRFKVSEKAVDNVVNFSHTVYLFQSAYTIRARACADLTLEHTSTESVSELSITASGGPALFGWLQVDG